MNETLDRRLRKARKQHRCDYCGEAIEKGEVYDWSKFVYDGDIYEWHCHQKCGSVAGDIWDYADPDEGMDEELFQDSCRAVCQNFVCPDCEKWNAEYGDCDDDKTYCIDRLHEFFKTYELYRAGRDGYAEIWKVRKKTN